MINEPKFLTNKNVFSSLFRVFVIVLAISLTLGLVPKEPEIHIYTKFADFKHLLEKDNDTTYVVNFWATWCKPCVE